MTRISSLQGLTVLPNDIRWDEFSCAMVEAPWAVEFLDMNKPGNRQEAARYPAGVAFGEASELRWLTRESGMHVVYISDSGKDLGAESRPETLDPVEATPACMALWGERQEDGRFYEGRIPRMLEYPAWAPEPKVGGRLVVRLQHYRLSEAGRTTPMFRCVRLAMEE